MKKRALDAVLAAQWVITPEYLNIIAGIADRESEYMGNLEALEAKLGRPLGNTRTMSVRDGIAILPVEGPMFKRASFFQAISGATDYTTMATDLAAALDNPEVQAVMLVIDTPGGEVNGISDLTAMLKGAGKTVWAHVDGQCCSGGYWLASAASHITASDTAVLGSVGAQIGMRVSAPREGEKAYRFVSSVSPLKNAEPGTDEGAAAIQSLADDLGNVFVDTVAQNMAVSREHVLANFGKGAVMVASKAKAAGMIHGVSTFEAAFSALKQELSSMNYEDLTAQALAEKRPDIVSAIRTEALASVEKVDAEAIKTAAVTAERQRMTAIDALAMPGAEKIVADCKADGTTAEAAAMKIVKHMQAVGAETGNTALANIKKAETEMVPPVAAENGGAATDGDKIDADMAALRKAGIVR